MSATITGKAAIWGVGTAADTSLLKSSADVLWAGPAAANAVGIIISADYERGGDAEPLDDEYGETIGMADYNLNKRVTMTIQPASRDATPTIAEAATNLTNLLPAKGTAVKVVNPIHANFTTFDTGDTSKNYRVESARVRTTNKGWAVVEMEVMQFDANDVTTAVT